MRRRALQGLLVGICLFIICLSAAQGPAAEVKQYIFGTGPMGGPWRIGIGAAVQILNEELKGKYSFTAGASGGSIENIRRLVGGEYHTIWAHVHNLSDAWTGEGLFKNEKPYKDLRIVEKITDQAMGLVVLAKSPVKSYTDLVGKRVCAGPAGSGNVLMVDSMFKALGIAGQVRMAYISFEAGAQALKDKQVDAVLAGGGPYVLPSIVEISRSTEIRMVEPTAEEANKISAGLPYLIYGVIPPNKAPGENANRERKAFFYSTFWAAQASMLEDAVFSMLKITQDPKNKETLGKVLSFWNDAGPSFDTIAKMGIPLHPGAAKFWQSQGIKLAPETVK